MRKIFSVFFVLVFCSCSSIIPIIIPFKDLPPPTGSYNVGTRVFNWEDKSREEWFTEEINDLRKIVLQVWYPSIDTASKKMPYLDYADQRVGPISKQIELPKFLIEHIQDVKSNSYLNIDIKPSVDPYPLVIFSHGLGGMRMQNTIQMEELASRGYIVIAIDHPYDANITIFDDGSEANYKSGIEGDVSPQEFWDIRLPQINTRANDIIFLIDTIVEIQKIGDDFWSLIDLSRIGVMGHSFGGATAIVASSIDKRLDACIVLDAWLVPVKEEIINKGLLIPFLFIGQPKWENPLNYNNLDILISKTEVASKIILDGTKHMDFSDTPQFNSKSAKLGVSGTMDLNELRITLNTQIVSFFKKHL